MVCVKRGKPRAFCLKCGEPIFDNVDLRIPSVWHNPLQIETEAIDVICADCVQTMVNTTQQKEQALKTKFASTEDFTDKMTQFKAKMKEKKMPSLGPIQVLSKGERLKKARKKAGLSQKELAFLLRIGRTAITNYEKNLRRLPEEVFRFVIKIEDTPKNELKKIADLRNFLKSPGESVTENGELSLVA